MSFSEAIRTCFSKYADFSGRAGRAEFWWWFLFGMVVQLAFYIPFAITRNVALGLVYFLLAVALLLPNLAVCVRRLHDTGRIGWWILIGLIPIVGPIVLIVFCVAPGSQGPNGYGPPTQQLA